MRKIKKVTDIYGTIEIDEDVHWGSNTQRSLKNFPIGNEKMPKELIEAIIQLKKAIAFANRESNNLSKNKADLIIQTCDKLLQSDFYKHFPLSIWQTGSGTQTNMNANEVIANFANEISEDIEIHPNDDVNHGQSTNDVFPTSMHIATTQMITQDLIPVLDEIISVLESLEIKFEDAIGIGRTHLQDATPIKLSQKVSGWTHMFKEGKKQLNDVLPYFRTLSIGATAVGTGLNTYQGFDEDVCAILNENLDEKFTPSENKFHAISTKDAFVFGHGALNAIATNSLKLANDIRWLSSGPRAGIGELTIPSNEAGSSIMPGKINPTQSEALSMVCTQVMANNNSISFASSQGNFELNVYMPLIMHNMWQSLRLLSDSLKSFNDRTLKGMTLNEDKTLYNLTNSLMSATYLNKKFGYDEVSRIVKEAHDNKTTIKAVVVEHDLMGEEEFDEFFDYNKMVKPDEK